MRPRRSLRGRLAAIAGEGTERSDDGIVLSPLHEAGGVDASGSPHAALHQGGDACVRLGHQLSQYGHPVGVLDEHGRDGRIRPVDVGDPCQRSRHPCLRVLESPRGRRPPPLRCLPARFILRFAPPRGALAVRRIGKEGDGRP